MLFRCLNNCIVLGMTDIGGNSKWTSDLTRKLYVHYDVWRQQHFLGVTSLGSNKMAAHMKWWKMDVTEKKSSRFCLFPGD